MNAISATRLGMLLRCYEGLRNWRALAVLVAGFMAAAVCWYWMASSRPGSATAIRESRSFWVAR